MFVDALKSKFGRRLLAKFIVVSLLPILILAFYTYFQTYRSRLATVYTQVERNSNEFILILADRLNLQSSLLNAAAEGLSQRHAPGTLLTHIKRLPASALSTLGESEQHHLLSGKPVIVLNQSANQNATILSYSSSQKILRKAQLVTSHLWRNDMAPRHYCVLTWHAHPLYCSPSLRNLDVRAIFGPDFSHAHSRGVFTFALHGVSYIAGYSRMGLHAAFYFPGLIVLIARQKNTVLGPIYSYGRFYLALTLLILSLAIWLAITQIRRQLKPLSQLMQRTQDIRQGKFESESLAVSDDEFGQLNLTFNSMAEALNYRFKVQQASATLDREILQLSSIEPFIQALRQQLVQLTGVKSLAIVYWKSDDVASIFGRSHAVITNAQQILTLKQLMPTEERDFAALGDNQSDALRAMLSSVDSQWQGIQTISCVALGTRTTGLLCIGSAHAQANMHDLSAQIMPFLDRLYVAESRFQMLDQLRHQATHDPLTQLPNRVLLADRTLQALNRAQRHGAAIVLLIVDLDQFKEINDSLGHAAGDELLQVVATLLERHVRKADTVARFGGDEFLILMPDLTMETAAQEALHVIERINAALRLPVDVQNHRLSVGLSTGVAVYPTHADNFDDLLKMADAAMYEAKADPRLHYKFYSTRLDHEIHERFALSQALHHALDNHEMLLHFQPKVTVDGLHICGAEALIRWRSADHGLISPGVFIPLADQIGLSDRITAWVLHTTLHQLAQWRHEGLPEFPVAINVQTSQLQDPGFSDFVIKSLDDHGIKPSQIEVEILESAVVNESVVIRTNIDKLRAHGIRVALDDFGTGYSSLSYLMRVPADVLKLDMSFIKPLAQSNRQQIIVERIISLAKTLQFEVIAEGVENREQLEILRRSECEIFQGFLFSKPVSAQAFTQLLESSREPIRSEP